jgi:hypothetical protein
MTKMFCLVTDRDGGGLCRKEGFWQDMATPMGLIVHLKRGFQVVRSLLTVPTITNKVVFGLQTTGVRHRFWNRD